MKIQITENDIHLMAEAAVKTIAKCLNEWEYNDEDPYLLTAMLYNPITKKYAIWNPPTGPNSWREAEEKAFKYAKDLGDGPVFNITFDITDYGVSDDSFSYDIGMDSGVHNDYSYYVKAVKMNEFEFYFTLENGEIDRYNGKYDEMELTPEDEAFINKEANDNINSFDCE